MPNDVRWPPGSDVDFESVLSRLTDLKVRHFPQHTARDPADPVNQILALIAALGQHALSRVNAALKQLDPRTAVSRRAISAMMELVGRPLRPMRPARGYVYGRLAAAPVADTVYIDKNTRFTLAGGQDPVFSVDSDVASSDSVAFQCWWDDTSAGTITPITFGSSFTIDDGDAIIVGFERLCFTSVTLAYGVTVSAGAIFIAEHYNKEWGTPDTITWTGSQLVHYLDTYLHLSEIGSSLSLIGVRVTVKYKGTNTTEVVTVVSYASRPVAVTTAMGQSSPSTSTGDYSIYAEWQPLAIGSFLTAHTSSSTVSWAISKVLSSTNWWSSHDDYGYAIRFRHVTGSGSLPQSIRVNSASSTGDFYCVASITQGVVKTITIGSTNGSPWQHVPVSSDPIEEPVEDPKLAVSVGGDSDWFVAGDFANSGPTSKHCVFREDPDTGWGLVFGDGSVGYLPALGSAVKLTYRTGSVQSGNIEAGVEIKAAGASGLVKDFVLPRSTSGFEVAEASDRASAIAFRNAVIPQLGLRAESVVTALDITTALTGGAPGRATFETADGRRPFSRAHYSVTSAGPRQYIVAVVGGEDVSDGSVNASDLDEAQTWLNGEEIGVEIIGGHGPQNTEAVVNSFSAVPLLPTVSIIIPNTVGVRATAESVIREFMKPHSKDETGEYRFDFGGRVPVALLFGALWSALPGRTLITVSVSDGVTSYGLGDSVQLDEFELPTLSDSFDPLTHITVSSS